MQFLRTLFWVVLAVIAVIFANKNWTPVEVSLWGGIVADVKLPVLLVIAFLLGLVPMLLVYQTSRWRMRRRIDSAERAIAELRPATSTAPPVPLDPDLPMPTAYSPPVASPFAGPTA